MSQQNPSRNEVDDAIAKNREAVGAHGVTVGRLMFLKLVFRNGDSTTICMRPQGAKLLSQAVTQLIQAMQSTGGPAS
jgi:hypothetical protein